MNKNFLTGLASVRVLPLAFVLLLLLSCRKDFVVPETPEADNGVTVDKVNIRSVSYERYQQIAPSDVIERSKRFNNFPKSGAKGAVMTVNDRQSLTLNLDSVKILTIEGKRHFVFSFNPSSPKAVQFHTYTISETDEGIKQFITAYAPSKKWLEAWRKNERIPFEGETSVFMVTEPPKPQATGGTGRISNANIPDNRIAVIVTTCETIVVHDVRPVHCDGTSAHLSVPPVAGLQYNHNQCTTYQLVNFHVSSCTTTDIDLGAGGFGGGGATYPYVPPAYDPCYDGLPEIGQGSTRLTDRVMVVPPPEDCPEGPIPLPGYSPGLAMRVFNVSQALNLTSAQRDFLYEHPTILDEVELKLQQDDVITENIKSAIEFIRVIFSSYTSYGGAINEQIIDAALTSSLPLAYGSVKNVLIPYLRYQAALEFEADPTLDRNDFWDAALAYHRAFDEVLNLGLDMAGMVPVIGEVFDIISCLKYGLTGNYTDATLSALSAFPIVGNVPATARILKNGKKLIAAMDQYGTWRFPRRSLRAGLGMGKIATDPRIAHHIIPLKEFDHDLIQKAVYDKYDLNDALKNGMPIDAVRHTGDGLAYSGRVRQAMDNIVAANGGIENISPERAASLLTQLADHIKMTINTTPPGIHIDNIFF